MSALKSSPYSGSSGYSYSSSPSSSYQSPQSMPTSEKPLDLTSKVQSSDIVANKSGGNSSNQRDSLLEDIKKHIDKSYDEINNKIEVAIAECNAKIAYIESVINNQLLSYQCPTCNDYGLKFVCYRQQDANGQRVITIYKCMMCNQIHVFS